MSNTPSDVGGAVAKRLGAHAVGLVRDWRRRRSALSVGNPPYGAESMFGRLSSQNPRHLSSSSNVSAADSGRKTSLYFILNASDNGCVTAALWRQSRDEDKMAVGQAN